MSLFGESVLLVGGSGSVGESLLRSMSQKQDKVVLSVISRNPKRQSEMAVQFPSVNFYVGEMQNQKSMELILDKVQPSLVVIAAGMVSVSLCEDNISDSMNANVSNLIQFMKAIDAYCLKPNEKPLKTIVYISSGNACNPINVYGMSKALGEKVITSMSQKHSNNMIMPKFLTVRFGNLLQTRFGIVRKYQEIAADPLLLSFPLFGLEMTRFFMTGSDCANLIANACKYGQSGEIWVCSDLGVAVSDIAQFFSLKFKKPIQVMERKNGEKLHECLINETELERVRKHNNYWIIQNGCLTESKKSLLQNPFTSSTCRSFISLQSEIE
jgi:UDP-N-acetylglucosamine 4,6-dehydratase